MSANWGNSESIYSLGVLPPVSSRPEEFHLRALPEPCMTLSSHTAPDVRSLLEAKLKTLLRKTDPRTTETTWRGIGILLDRFKPEECANYLVNAGYASA